MANRPPPSGMGRIGCVYEWLGICGHDAIVKNEITICKTRDTVYHYAAVLPKPLRAANVCEHPDLGDFVVRTPGMRGLAVRIVHDEYYAKDPLWMLHCFL
ncbi:hypothetical protein H0G86_007638 [Trichoderma simmonsii]|uniref:Uncharacterized protein n=1 Tax=Trichoderma simmonsii TaxID=1491479 RepID=A0A8G0LGX6_9HYPO|nr:hypothetical protein H0G86_007638 [Trichoderma simmonsii]